MQHSTHWRRPGLAKVGADSGVPGWIAGLDIENLGYAIVAILVSTWVAAFAYWKIAKVESRYSAGLPVGAAIDRSGVQ